MSVPPPGVRAQSANAVHPTAPDPVPQNAGATRGRHVRALLGGRFAGYALGLGVVGGFVAGAALSSPALMVGAPAAVVALVVGVSFLLADRRAEGDFFEAYTDARGYSYALGQDLLPLTPLLGAGERRSCRNWIEGRLGERMPDARFGLGHYTYETREVDSDHDGPGGEVWRKHHFTICVVDLEPGIVLFPGVFLERRLGFVALLGAERWLSRHGKRKVELESNAFVDRYELLVDRTQDDVGLRELFSPSFIVWLADHPLAPCFEYRAGTLVAYVDRRLEDAEGIDALIDATAGICHRIREEVSEESSSRAA